jgi:hypothetical protein
MTKKDYMKIAAMIKNTYGTLECSDSGMEYCLSDLVQGLAVVFASDNPRFDQGRFLKACGL